MTKSTKSFDKVFTLLLKILILSVYCTGAISNAMVIRHDVAKGNYIADESKFPALFPIHDDGVIKNCVATLIAPQWAITAGHCTILINKEKLSSHPHNVVIASKNNQVINYFTPDSFGKFIVTRDEKDNITDVRPEAEVDFTYDIALLKLANPVTHVKPMKIYNKTDEVDKKILLLGWGDFGTGEIGIDEQKPINDRKFRLAWNQVTSIDGNRLHFVFDDPKNGKALPLEGVNGPGDSGGPALIKMPNGFQILAISSGGDYPEKMANKPEKTGQYGWEESYIRMSMLENWLKYTMNKHISR